LLYKDTHMAFRTKPGSIKRVPPAQLWVGSHKHALQAAVTYLQHQFCPRQGCGQCTLCVAVQNQQFHAIDWVIPEKTYKIEHIAHIVRRTSFSATMKNFSSLLQKQINLPLFAATSCSKWSKNPLLVTILFLLHNQNIWSLIPFAHAAPHITLITTRQRGNTLF
jgi:hypothetical protein